jgi:hypothetical protein
MDDDPCSKRPSLLLYIRALLGFGLGLSWIVLAVLLVKECCREDLTAE